MTTRFVVDEECGCAVCKVCSTTNDILDSGATIDEVAQILISTAIKLKEEEIDIVIEEGGTIH